MRPDIYNQGRGHLGFGENAISQNIMLEFKRKSTNNN